VGEVKIQMNGPPMTLGKMRESQSKATELN
jgi:hypothetical protein